VKTKNGESGFFLLMLFPLFLIILMTGTVVAASLSYAMRTLSCRDMAVQAYSALEDSSLLWQERALSDSWKSIDLSAYEQVVSTRNVGPYILLIKEIRNRKTGQVLVNRLEIMPIGKADVHGS
jgi:hypothetical protein